MATYTTNEIRAGRKLMIDSAPCVVIECEFVKPGKGRAFARVKLRNLLTRRVMERRGLQQTPWVTPKPL